MTFLLFLKMADEQSRPPFNKPSPVPKEFAWPTLLKPEGEALEAHYRRTLQELGAHGGMLGASFRWAFCSPYRADQPWLRLTAF